MHLIIFGIAVVIAIFFNWKVNAVNCLINVGLLLLTCSWAMLFCGTASTPATARWVRQSIIIMMSSERNEQWPVRRVRRTRSGNEARPATGAYPRC